MAREETVKVIYVSQVVVLHLHSGQALGSHMFNQYSRSDEVERLVAR